MSISKQTVRAALPVVFLLAAVTARGVEVQHQDSVAYVSGGVGDDERKAIEAMSGQFNLKVTFALASGHFLGGAHVRIVNAQGATVLNATTDGPLFYAHLKPGAYTVKVNRDGKEVERATQVAESGQQHLEFTWKEE